MTKSSVNRLGKEIRKLLKEGNNLPNDKIERLQEYRVSFKPDISQVFNEVSRIARKIRNDSLVSLRIKRIESILSKIQREPTMTLGNMGDIAGCRIIAHSKSALTRMRNEIEASFNVIRIKDHLNTPKSDGYRALHIYVQSPLNKHKIVEIQLRHIRVHMWASLVEIVDIIKDLKLKEGQEHADLEEFFLLLAKRREELNTREIERIIQLDNSYEVYQSLRNVFIQNHMHVRESWTELQADSNRKKGSYFIIQVDVNKRSFIYSYKDYEEAEREYFQKFRADDNTNFVLIFIDKPKFKNVCVAYASYILTKHNYLDDWLVFVRDYLKDKSKHKGSKDYRDIVSIYSKILDQELELINREIAGLVGTASGMNVITKETQEWYDELIERRERFQRLRTELDEPIFTDEYKNLWKRMKKALKSAK